MLFNVEEIKISFLDSLLVFLIGFAIIALVLGILIGFIVLIKLFFQIKWKKTKKSDAVSENKVNDENLAVSEDDEELVAVITAALMAYYSQQSDVVAPFRIKKIHR